LKSKIVGALDYILHILIFICLYTLLAQSLNLSAGLTGLISLAHAGFYGIGAYTTAILSKQFHLPFWVNLPAAILICLAISSLVSLISLRTIDDYFIICTLGIQAILFSLMNNWMEITNGPLGISGIPPISFFGFSIESNISFSLLSLFFMLFIWLIMHKISTSAFGKTLRAINEDEIYTKSIGKNVYRTKVTSYVISAVLATIPGALYAHYVSYIDPFSFTISESIFILSIVIIGGMGNFIGSFWAASFMVLLPEALRFFGMPSSMAANTRQIIYGLILVLIMMSGKNGLGELLRRKKETIQ
jgi:branched-chain amino acid transport system permease protein